jgi:hypothetical protein
MLMKCLFQTMKHKLYNPKWNFFNVLVKHGYVGAQSNREFWRNELFNNKDKNIYIYISWYEKWYHWNQLWNKFVIILKLSGEKTKGS